METNTSGIVPLDMRILVKPDEPVTKIGNVHIPQSAADKAKYAGMKATLIAAAVNAFKEWGADATVPAPGDRVLFAQYSGARHKGADGADYIVMLGADLLGLLTEEGAS